MIGFVRLPEPVALVILRTGKLADACTAMASGAKIDFSGYDIIKDELFAMQHRKCCYCEKLEEQAKYRDVEHYRPKALYWWLAWTWENLLFACIDCNRDQKRDQFPLTPGDTQLLAGQQPPGAERPLVLDPADRAMDPAQEIEFRRERVHGKERWVPRGVTVRGRRTIEVCGLDRPNLLDWYAEHVAHAVRPKLEGFFTAHQAGDVAATLRAWDRAKRGLLAPERPFRALSHDALNVLAPIELRTRYRLALDRPQP